MSQIKPSDRLAEKLATLQLDQLEADVLNRILHRAEGGDAREAEVEGFAAPSIPPLMPGGLPLLTPMRLRAAAGVKHRGGCSCDGNPTEEVPK